MQTIFTRSLVLAGTILAGAASLAIGTAAQADVPQIGTHATVRYDDLDLATDGGRKALDQRVHRAADAVCGADTDALYRFTTMACREKALNGAYAELRAKGAVKL